MSPCPNTEALIARTPYRWAATVEGAQRSLTTRPVIYFVEAIGLGLIKVGWSKGLSYRLECLGRESPTPLRLLGWRRAWSRSEEQALHITIEHLRHHHEWFRDAPELRALIRNREKAHA